MYRTGCSVPRPPPPLAESLEAAEWEALRFCSMVDAWNRERQFRRAYREVTYELAQAERASDAGELPETVPPRSTR